MTWTPPHGRLLVLLRTLASPHPRVNPILVILSTPLPPPLCDHAHPFESAWPWTARWGQTLLGNSDRWLAVETQTCRAFQVHHRARGLAWPLSRVQCGPTYAQILSPEWRHRASNINTRFILNNNHIIFDRNVNILLLGKFEGSGSPSMPFFPFATNLMYPDPVGSLSLMHGPSPSTPC